MSNGEDYPEVAEAPTEPPEKWKREEISEEDYKDYLEERKILVAARSTQFNKFDQTITTISAGALVLSITFIGQVVPNIKEGTIGLLITGWIFLAVSLLAILFSYQLSQLAYARQIEILEEYYFHDKNLDNRPAFWVNIINGFSAVTLVIGVVCLIIFTTCNLT